MRRICVFCTLMLTVAFVASCSNGQPSGPVTTLSAPVITTEQMTAVITVPEVTTPEEKTSEETTPEQTTPAVTEPDFSNEPDDNGTKRY